MPTLPAAGQRFNLQPRCLRVANAYTIQSVNCARRQCLLQSWPRALRYRSDETTRGFVQIAEQAGDHFPDAVKTILPLIRPVPNADMLTYRISRDRKDKENIARHHPQMAMRLLNAITPDDRARMLYELAGALDALAELDPHVKDMAEYRRLKDLLE